MSEQEDLEQAITAVEAQRATLGDTAVDAILEGLRQKLAELQLADSQARQKTDDLASASERRIVTVLFCDVVGSTALAEKMDPEIWAEIMDEAFEYLTEPIDRFGGTVARLMGDAILAFFGAPVAHENDPQRAVLAGLAILENIESFRKELQRNRGLNFNVRVGINTGLVVTGRIGTKLHEEYTALGDAVNLAERMEETAAAGTVQLSENTYKLVAAAFEFDEARLIGVEEKTTQVVTYRVLGQRIEKGQLRGLATYGIASSLIGRDSEISTASAAIERLLQGQGGILYIIGEAGIGKSRLVSELHKQSQGENLTWLNGRTLPYGQSSSYWLFQEILRQFGGIREEDSEAEAWSKLERGVQALFPQESPEIFPYLAGLMSLEARGEYVERVRYLDGEALRDQISVATRRFFERLAQKQPLLLVFEDLHRVDASSARLIEHLLPLVEQTRLLICAIGRPDPNPAAGHLYQKAIRDYGRHYSEITLSPLEKTVSRQLVNNVLANDDQSVRTREMIVEKAGGNPFYLEEIIHDLIEAGALTQDTANGRWRATSRIETINIPDTVQGVIAARIDRLNDGVKRVLRAAAVIGNSFSLQLLTAVIEPEPSLPQQLTVLETAELIHLQQRAPELLYTFKQSLAQEVTYRRILLQERRRLHLKVGQAVETLFADHLEEYYGLLAYHYAQAEAWEPAQEYLLKAGDQAGQVAAGFEALTHYRHAQEAYEKAFGHKWDPLQRAELASKMGEAYYGLGRLAQSQKYFQDALSLLDRPLPQSRLGLLLSLVGQLFRQTLHRLRPSRFINSAAQERRPALRELVRAYERLGVISYIQGEAASSIYAFLRSLNLAEPAGPSPELARAYANNVIAAALIPPLRFMADRYSQLALGTAGDSDDLAALAWVCQLIGIYNLGVGRWTAAIDAGQQAVDINKRIGRLRRWEESTAGLAQALHLRGNFARSQSLYPEISASGRERGDQQTQVWALAGLVETGLRLAGSGHKDEMIDYLEQAQALLTEYRYPNRPDEIQITGLLAQGRLRRNEWALAREAASRASHLIATEWPPSTFYTFEAYAGLPLVYMGLWQAELDGRYTATEQEDFEKLTGKACRDLHNYARVFPIAKPRAALWQGAYEWLMNKPAKARKSWQKSLDYAERLDMPYDIGLVCYEIGRHLPQGDPLRKEHLQRAAHIFSQLGAAWDLANVRNLAQPDSL
jgi:class 3 adenylate cyclase/tetratricopeptide (TPR) repeat protein